MSSDCSSPAVKGITAYGPKRQDRHALSAELNRLLCASRD
jgi:hypothetical protein